MIFGTYVDMGFGTIDNLPSYRENKGLQKIQVIRLSNKRAQHLKLRTITLIWSLPLGGGPSWYKI